MPNDQYMKRNSALGRTKKYKKDNLSICGLSFENNSHSSENQSDDDSSPFHHHQKDSIKSGDWRFNELMEGSLHQENREHMNMEYDRHENADLFHGESTPSNFEDPLSPLFRPVDNSNSALAESESSEENLELPESISSEPSIRRRLTPAAQRRTIRKKKQLLLQQKRQSFPYNLRCSTGNGKTCFLLWELFDSKQRIENVSHCMIEVIPKVFFVEIEFKLKHIIGGKKILHQQTFPFQKMNFGETRFQEWLKQEKESVRRRIGFLETD